MRSRSIMSGLLFVLVLSLSILSTTAIPAMVVAVAAVAVMNNIRF